MGVALERDPRWAFYYMPEQRTVVQSSEPWPNASWDTLLGYTLEETVNNSASNENEATAFSSRVAIGHVTALC